MSTTFTYQHTGTCSTNSIFEIEDNKIVNVEIMNGCNGNLKGICALIKGKDVDEVISLLEGITCGPRPTSCPDQIAHALKAYKEQSQ